LPAFSLHKIAFAWRLLYDCNMQQSSEILCDGCGQPAGPGHIARRLKRLENMTRYRPIHVQALFLAATGPAADTEYLYSAQGEFAGGCAEILRASGIEVSGRAVEAALTEFQRRGYVLTYLVECAQENGSAAARREALRQRISPTIARIRRSLKPKRIVLLGSELTEVVPQLAAANLEATLILREGRPFEWTELGDRWLTKELTAPLEAL
jgi:hypothetical protein